jgi:hypothetical protein
MIDDNPLAELTPFDWIAVAVVAAGALFCFQFPFLVAPRFSKTWFPLMLGLNPASIAFHALSQKHTLARRRLLIFAAFAFAIVASGVCLGSMYLPIFALAGQIQ